MDIHGLYIMDDDHGISWIYPKSPDFEHQTNAPRNKKDPAPSGQASHCILETLDHWLGSGYSDMTMACKICI